MALSLCPGGLPRGEAVPKGLKGYFNMDKTKAIALRLGHGGDRAARAAHRYAAAGAAIAARSFGGHRRMRQRCRSLLSYWERGASGRCGWKKMLLSGRALVPSRVTQPL